MGKELAREALLDQPKGFVTNRRAGGSANPRDVNARACKGHPHKRTEDRKGYKPRALGTRVGTIDLLIPQDRQDTFSPRLVARYQREGAGFGVDEDVLGGGLEQEGQGSDRGFEWHLLLEELDLAWPKTSAQLEGWRNRLLVAESYRYICGPPPREEPGVLADGEPRRALIVLGVRNDGLRKVLATRLIDTESEATYHESFKSLNARGLKEVELVVSDEHGRLKATGHSLPPPGSSSVRYQVHYVRSLLGMVVESGERKKLVEGPEGSVRRPTKEVALRLASDLADRSGVRVPRRWLST